MADSIDLQEVQQVARLAKIDLEPQQLQAVTAELRLVLDYVNQLQAVNLPDELEPFFGAADAVNAIREDQVQPSVPREVILENAPDADGEYYRVPPVFE